MLSFNLIMRCQSVTHREDCQSFDNIRQPCLKADHHAFRLNMDFPGIHTYIHTDTLYFINIELSRPGMVAKKFLVLILTDSVVSMQASMQMVKSFNVCINN